MTYNYQGAEYQVIHQMGSRVQITKAFRTMPNNFVEILMVEDYKALGEIDVQKVELHIQDIAALAAMLEVRV
jgi:hypothetical protein